MDLQVKETKAYLVKHIKDSHASPFCCCSGNATGSYTSALLYTVRIQGTTRDLLRGGDSTTVCLI